MMLVIKDGVIHSLRLGTVGKSLNASQEFAAIAYIFGCCLCKMSKPCMSPRQIYVKLVTNDTTESSRFPVLIQAPNYPELAP